MNNKRNVKTEGVFFTGARVALTAVVLVAAAVVISSCNEAGQNSPEVAAGGNKPAVAGTTPAPAAGSASAQGARPSSPSANSLRNDVLPKDAMEAELQMLDGKTFRLTDYEGKIVVLDIWATWCGPCRHMIPHLIDIQKEYGSKGVEVLGLTTENPETDEQKVRDFARDFKINYKLGWSNADFILPVLGPRYSIPQTFLIGRDGKLYFHAPGYSPAVPTQLREKIEQLVKDA